LSGKMIMKTLTVCTSVVIYFLVILQTGFAQSQVAPPVNLTELKNRNIYEQTGGFSSFFGSLVINTKPLSQNRKKNILKLLGDNKLETEDYCKKDQIEILLSSTVTARSKLSHLSGKPKVHWEMLSLYCLTGKGVTLIASEEIQTDWEKQQGKFIWQEQHLSVVGLSQRSKRRPRHNRYPKIVAYGSAKSRNPLLSIQDSAFLKDKSSYPIEKSSSLEYQPLIIDPFGLSLLIKTMKIERDNERHNIHVIVDGKVRVMSLKIDFLEKRKEMNYSPFTVEILYKSRQPLMEVEVGGYKGRPFTSHFPVFDIFDQLLREPR